MAKRASIANGSAMPDAFGAAVLDKAQNDEIIKALFEGSFLERSVRAPEVWFVVVTLVHTFRIFLIDELVICFFIFQLPQHCPTLLILSRLRLTRKCHWFRANSSLVPHFALLWLRLLRAGPFYSWWRC
jgi:hypothetical protein